MQKRQITNSSIPNILSQICPLYFIYVQKSLDYNIYCLFLLSMSIIKYRTQLLFFAPSSSNFSVKTLIFILFKNFYCDLVYVKLQFQRHNKKTLHCFKTLIIFSPKKSFTITWEIYIAWIYCEFLRGIVKQQVIKYNDGTRSQCKRIKNCSPKSVQNLS